MRNEEHHVLQVKKFTSLVSSLQREIARSVTDRFYLVCKLRELEDRVLRCGFGGFYEERKHFVMCLDILREQIGIPVPERTFEECIWTHPASCYRHGHDGTWFFSSNRRLRKRQIQCQECPICFEKLQPGQIMVKTDCLHLYHASCLANWFLVNLTCPTCRHRIVHVFVARNLLELIIH
jgi:Ring finger domain